MTQIHQLIRQQLALGCGQRNCTNRFCASSQSFYQPADDSLYNAAIRIEAQYGPMALCLPSLNKLSAIFAQLQQSKSLIDAWTAHPIDDVIIYAQADFDLIGLAITCNLSTLDSLDFVLSQPIYTADFFNYLFSAERDSYISQCQTGKIVRMQNYLTCFIYKLIDSIFNCQYALAQNGYISVPVQLLMKLIQLPDCLLQRNSMPIACVAGLIYQLTSQSKQQLIDGIRQLMTCNGVFVGCSSIIAACNQYVAVKLANHDRPRHSISVLDLLPEHREVQTVLELMKMYSQLFSSMLVKQEISFDDYLPLKKLLQNDFINSNAYNITPDTDYWLYKNKTDERTDTSVLPVYLQLIMRYRGNQQFPTDMFSILDYSFILNGGTKAYIFKYDVTLNIPHISELKVRRELIVEDTLHFIEARQTDWMAFYSRAILRLPLKVVFDGEEGVDAGGLSNEFFSLIIEQLFHEKYNLFTFIPGSNVYYFNKFPCLEDNQLRKYYNFVGIILGLALINSVNVDAMFPTCFYKVLLNTPIYMDDLKDLDSDLLQALQKISAYEDPDFEDVFCLDFNVRETVFDEIVVYPLKSPADYAVTLYNKQEYIQLRWRYEMLTAVHSYLLALQEGFMQICDSASLDLLDFNDLSLMLCGEPSLDFLALQKVVRYQEPYYAESPIIRWFWHVVLEYSEKEKSDFCQFVFGSRRAPAGGLGKARFEIQKNGEDDIRLPTSHTCFGILMLPQYSSEDVLRYKLAVAIINNEGFGLY